MNQSQIALRAFLLAVITCTFASLAHAQATRTWVSGVGDDVNPCSRTAPCKTFAGAISKTNAQGEISALDPAGFGTVTITKSLTINGTGTLAGITNTTVNGIIVNAASDDVVILRELSFLGGSTGINGIRILAAGMVQVDRCWIYGQESHGIHVDATDNIKLVVNDSLIEDCSLDGIRVNTTTGEAVVTIDNTRIQECGSDGVQAVNNVRGAIRNSLITHNADAGIKTSGNNNQLNVERVFLSFAVVGLKASAGSSIRIADSVIAQNTTGLNANGGTLESNQGNSFMGNTANGAFSSTTIKQ